jgi:hypothetical protein
MLKNYRDLKVWQKSYRLCLDLFRITKKSQQKKDMDAQSAKSLGNKRLTP